MCVKNNMQSSTVEPFGRKPDVVLRANVHCLLMPTTVEGVTRSPASAILSVCLSVCM